MANTCRECGGDVFIGELRCPKCKAPIPNAREVAVAEGVRIDDGTTGGPPPPEGLGLIIDKLQTDQEITHRNEREAMGRYAPGVGSGVTWGGDDGSLSSAFGPAMGRGSLDDSYDAVADLVRPERDAHGNIKVDLKHALVGAVVVAVVAALAFWYFYNMVTSATRVTRFSTVS